MAPVALSDRHGAPGTRPTEAGGARLDQAVLASFVRDTNEQEKADGDGHHRGDQCGDGGGRLDDLPAEVRRGRGPVPDGPGQRLSGCLPSVLCFQPDELHPPPLGGKGKVEVVVPASAGAPPLVFGSEVSLTLKADKAGTHSFVLLAVLTSVPVSINLASEDAVKMTFNFEADGEFTATGMFAMLGAYHTP